MWPWQKRKSETELVTALFDDLADSLKKLVLAPRDKYAQRFLKSLSLLEDQAGNLKSESDVHKLGKESEIAIDRFAHAQRDCVERVFFDLDSSLRDLLSIIDETLISSDDFIAKTSSLTTRLSAASDLQSLEEIRSTIRLEVRALANSVKSFRDANHHTMEQYKTELDSMRKRLDEAQETARTDGLTQLPNRVSHEFYLNAIIKKATEGNVYSLALIDLDGFKNVNDKFGHSAGDEVLVQFAMKLKKSLGSNAFICRLGGDEFTIVSNKSAAELTNLLLVFRTELLSKPIDFHGKELEIGMSFGVSAIDGKVDYATLMSETDNYMYHYKRKHKREQVA